MNQLRRLIVAIIVMACLLPHTPGSLRPATATTDASPAWSTQLSNGGQIFQSSPTLADLDGDGKLEIVVGTTKLTNAAPYVAVLEDTGSIKWQVAVDDPINSSPAVADLDYPPDGVPEIIVSTGGDTSQSRGSVIALNSTNGSVRWKYDTTDAQGTGTPSGNFSSPTIGDVDNNGDLEIVFGSWDRNIYMLDHNGQRVWHYFVADSVWSTAALADINRDGALEIIIGTDIAAGGTLPDGYRPTDGGFVLILDKNGQKLARRQMNEIIASSPAIGDADGDGQLEVFVGTGYYYYERGKYTQPYVYGFRINTSAAEWQLEDLAGWPRPVTYAGISSPALADLDGNGDLEIIIGTGYNSGGTLYAWHHTGTAVNGFPLQPRDYLNKNSYISSSPTVADVDGDGELEIVFSMLWDVIVVGRNGVQEQNLTTSYSVFASPAIGDLDNDGRTDIVIGASHISNPNRGWIYNFELGANSYRANSQPWPMFHHDAQHTGRYPSPPQLAVSPGAVYILHQSGGPWTESAYLTIRNIGQGSLDWSVADKPGAVTVTPSSGTATTTAQARINVSATACSGWCNLGNIVITGTSGGNPAIGSPATIPVYLYVGQVSKSYLPLVMR